MTEESQEPKGQEQKRETDIVAKSGKPFQKTSAAAFAMSAKGFTQATHAIVQIEGGYAIRPKTDATAATIEQPPAPEPKPAPPAPTSTGAPEQQAVAGEVPEAPEEGVHWVTFADRSNEQEQEKVILTVNHDTLVITRMKKIPLPDRFIECAQHASRPHFKQLPGQPRKVTSHVHTYPFTIHGEATWDDYREMRRSGTEQARKDREREGASPHSS